MEHFDRPYETNAGDPEYNKAFTAIPSRVPATPHRVTPRPRIDGTQIAIVAGPEGEEIHPDEYGRIKLWFPWDCKAKKDGSDTCWVRVTQNWAGAGWGGQIIPRIGMEVMVTYLDGDPDRPVVTGVVPNPKQKMPYALPENKTKSVFRTNTHQSKDWKRMNELTFEDKENNEEIYMHAERDMNVEVEHDYSKIIGRDKIEYVRNDSVRRIDGDSKKIVRNNETNQTRLNKSNQIEGDLRLSVGVSNQSMTQPDATLRVFPQFKLMKDSFQSLNDTAKGPGDLLVNVGGKTNIRTTGSNSDISGSSKSIASGKNILISAEDNVIISAGKSIELRCGPLKVILKSDGKINILATIVSLLASRINLN
jgi:type VI secretion system secreted protein VgrG